MADDNAEEVLTPKNGGAGPVADRGCTDMFCIPIWAFAIVVFIIVTLAGLQDGDPHKLYLPRDYRGQYCGAKTNWADGTDLQAYPAQSYMQNLSATLEVVVQQFTCTSFAKSELQPTMNATELFDYQCACCLVPCGSCQAHPELGADITSVAGLQGTMSAKLGELKGVGTGSSNFFSSQSANADLFSKAFNEATKYFNAVCLKDCHADHGYLYSLAETQRRQFVFELAPDHRLYPYYRALKAKPSLKAQVESLFTFTALPETICKYEPQFCVPLPGVEIGETLLNRCNFSTGSSVSSAVGSQMAEAYSSIGVQAFQDQASSVDGLGKAFGEWSETLDTFVLTAFSSLIMGLIFMVLLRMALGTCVWLSIFALFVIIMFGGGVSWVRSRQCSGVSLLDAGRQTINSAAALAEHHANQAKVAASGEDSTYRSEALTGDGADYRGMQRRSISGYSCLPWGLADASNPSVAAYTAAAFPTSGLDNPNPNHEFCRNPYDRSIANNVDKASTIWCFTSDTEVLWEECLPLNVLTPECKAGYAVTSEGLRKVLEIVAYVIWALGVIYLLAICCMSSRICLAISINKVAAVYVSHNPLVLLVPTFQALLQCCWMLLWMFCASFLLSQVPDDYVKKEGLKTYAEAYGTADTPGVCTGKFPTGGIWKEELGCGTFTNARDAACWRCYPPRFMFDWRFAVSFFVFLWTNALQIALGELIVGMSAVLWFFTPNDEKGSNSTGVIGSTAKVFRYHSGSAMFGSLIIAIVQFIRALMYYFEKNAQAQKNQTMAIILKVVQCLLWCFEKCLKFLNKNAYIQICIKSTNFCTSAKNAFSLIMANALRFSVIIFLGGGVAWLGSFFITSATVGLGYLYLSAMHQDANPTIPVVSFIIMGYVASTMYMQVFGMAVDTILQCFIHCETEKLDGDFVPEQVSRWLDLEKTKDDKPEPEKDRE